MAFVNDSWNIILEKVVKTILKFGIYLAFILRSLIPEIIETNWRLFYKNLHKAPILIKANELIQQIQLIDKNNCQYKVVDETFLRKS